MWPLSFFESSASLIPEVDSPTSWDGLILYAIMLLVYLGFLYWLNKKFGLLRKGIIIAGLIWLGIYILGVGIGSRGYMLINMLAVSY
ncbi:MAG: hypothetical protein N3A72_12235 [bacterium]|nr:hypothetical protein [bacterium]